MSKEVENRYLLVTHPVVVTSVKCACLIMVLMGMQSSHHYQGCETSVPYLRSYTYISLQYHHLHKQAA